ncbi:MAG TPA: histidine kinase [Gammaproteobacteria bacterium]|nr:histidine kinase [Gammaproteobacteria bacterium]
MDIAKEKNQLDHRRLLGITFAGWMLWSLLFASSDYLGAMVSDQYISVLLTFGSALLASFPWAVVGFLVLFINRHRPDHHWPEKIWLLKQLGFGMLLVYAILMLMHRWQWPVLGLPAQSDSSSFLQMLLVGLPRGFAMYLGVWGICQTGLFWRDYMHARHELVRAELRRLRTQLNPHFLFNTLNAISELGYENPEAADRTITQLSGLLRKSLDDSHQQEIALRDEVDFLERYLAIQQTLLQDRLHVKLEISDDTLNARVPGMILQPLVENAVTHGIRRSGTGHITVRSRRRGELLVIEVEDNGWGLVIAHPHKSGAGIGINNTRARLRYLYGEFASLELRSRPGEGLTACLNIPFHEAFAFDENPYPDH